MKFELEEQGSSRIAEISRSPALIPIDE